MNIGQVELVTALKIVRWMLCIIALSAMIIGCGEETPDSVTSYGGALHAPDAYSEWWQIVRINGKQRDFVYGNVFFRQVRSHTYLRMIEL